MFDITRARFFGSKAAAVAGTEVVAERQVGDFSWQLLKVDLGGTTETYQVLLGGSEASTADTTDALSTDALSTDAGATAYAAALPELGEVHGELRAGAATPLGAEQSNTSLVVGDTIVKAFRRLEDGLNPDVELLSRIDSPHVAQVHGYVTRGAATIAMQQARVAGTDGFDLAVAGRIDESSARDLGAAVANVHAALAAEFGTVEVPASQVRDQLHARLTSNIARAGVLEGYAPRLRPLIDAACTTPTLTVQRVHGDLHLGQTLGGADRWYLIDFEGEPARPLEERRRPDHPLRDVAGMVRSFGYAAGVGKHDAHWEQTMVTAFLDGYGQRDAGLLAAYIADKAAYEVAYEANNRPDWVDIPLAALEAITRST